MSKPWQRRLQNHTWTPPGYEEQTSEVFDVAASSDGQFFVSCGKDRVLRKTLIKSGVEVKRMMDVYPGQGEVFINSVVYSASGEFVVTSSKYDRDIQLWNSKSERAERNSSEAVRRFAPNNVALHAVKHILANDALSTNKQQVRTSF